MEDIILYLFFALGYGGIAYSIYTTLMSIKAKQWVKTQAKIFSSTMDTSCDEDGCTHEAKILYSYSFKGASYQSNRIGFGYSGNSIKFIASRLRNKFIPGKNAIIYVNPKRPKSSVLVVGIRPFHIFNIIFFIIIAFAAQMGYEKKSSNNALKSLPTVAGASAATQRRPLS